MGRDGKNHDRNIYADVDNFRVQSNITLIVCLLNDSELRTLGVNVKDYKAACDKSGVIFYQYPIIEMAPPEDILAFKTDVIDVICAHLRSGNGNILVHCRGGVGRAGLVTCCVLSTLC
jgi:protein-tyrosine phosphatase